MQPSNSCKQARLWDQMEYQPRCSKPVVKPLSLTLPGCSKCSGSMASCHWDLRDANMDANMDLRDAKHQHQHLYKNKGDLSSCDNHRGISLLSIAGKILARIMLNRITKHILDDVVSESQCGFRKQRGMVDMVFAIRQLQEKCVEQHQDLHLLFIDLTKAFDSVNRAALGDTQQAWMPTSICTDHPLLP